jgi:hypothetical protein
MTKLKHFCENKKGIDTNLVCKTYMNRCKGRVCFFFPKFVHLNENWSHNCFKINKNSDNTMKTINITISEVEFNKFGLKSTNFTFSEWIDIISREIAKQRLNQSVELAEKYGLSSMTMDEITREVNAVRKDAKNSY